VLKKRVEQELKGEHIRRVSLLRLLNAIFIIGISCITMWLSFYTMALFWIKTVYAFVTGVFIHLYATHIFHDLGHSSFSHNPSIWEYIGMLDDFIVGNSKLMWIYRHNLGHHLYTNVSELDPDTGKHENLGDMTLYESLFTHQNTPAWVRPFIYLLTFLAMKIEETVAFVTRRFANIRMNEPTALEKVHFYGSKVTILLCKLVLPVLLGYVTAGQAIILTLIIEAISGVCFGVFSQLNHVTLDREWLNGPEIEKDWATAQVLTSIDYCHDSWFFTYMSGFLNYQVVHHLFPSHNPHLYPRLAPIVKQVCKEFNIHYEIKPTFMKAVNDHFEQLSRFAEIRKTINTARAEASTEIQ
jgi:fatty acid desaturase